MALASAGRLAPAQQPKAADPAPKSVVAPKPPPPDGPAEADGGLAPYLASTDQAIAYYQAKVKANPNDFVSYRFLGEMHERKAHEAGDLASFERAEAALRHALKLFPNYPRARASLAAVLCARHKFAEGLVIAEALVKSNPKDIDALATYGDALLELGRYDEAEASFKRLHELAPSPEVLARLANLAELRGQTDEANRLFTTAADRAREGGGPKVEAWYRARLGDLAFDSGKLDEAARCYEAVPEGVDPYHDATFGLARVRAGQGKLDEAIQLGKKAVAIGPDPHMLAFLGDLLALAGKADEAKAAYDRVEREAKGQDEHLRTLALFYADHDRDLADALALAEKDFAARKDIHGHDALAWALFKNGRAEDAAKSIAEALRLGTREAKLHYHAGMIFAGLGRKDEAREHLSKALEINPHFSPRQAEEARKALKTLTQP